MQESIFKIVDIVKNTLERTPPELASDIMEKGIVLAGGGALIKNLDKLLSQVTGMPVLIADNPLDCVARGAGKNATMSSLKESGALEANGDYIMILNRPYVQDKSGEYQPSQAELLIDKNKFGNTGKVDLYFSGEYQKFSCVDNRWEQE